MSEEQVPTDNDQNEEVSAELNEQVVQDTTEEQEVVVTDNEEDKAEEATQEVSETEVVEEHKIEEEGGSEEDQVEPENSEAPEPKEELAEATETPAVEGGGIMAAAVAAAAVNTEPIVDEPKKEAPVDDGKRWYSLRVISGKERKIKERIELEIQRNKWSSAVSQVLVPSEKVYKIRSGKKVILERNILPGYILIEAHYKKFSPEIVQGIANIPNVIHFLGKTKPIPMQQSEANRMLGKVDESQEVGEALIEPFIVGETVKIIDGPFNGFVGDIKEVNEEKKKLKVIVKIFGRGTEVELNFMQVDKES